MNIPEIAPLPGEPGYDLAGLIAALKRQKQCDEDGVMCEVSRQAVDEAIAILCRQPTPEAADIETPVAEYHADLEGLRGIALGLRETARHHQMTQEDWINYSLHTADDINEFLRGLYYVPELTEKLYRALKAMPFPPHMPEAAGLQHDEAIRAYERTFPLLANPPKPEPTEEPYTQADYDRNAIKVPADVKVVVPSIAAPKPPAEWMAEARDLALEMKGTAERYRNIGDNMAANEVIKWAHRIEAIADRHYSAPAGTEAAAPKEE